MKNLSQSLSAAAISLVLVFATPSHAALWGRYDLDTLTEKSQLIVEGQIVAVTDPATGRVRVRVDRVDKGNTAPGDELLIDAGEYTKPDVNVFLGKPLEVGDRLFWFISPDQRTKPKAGGAAIWIPLAGGGKFISNDHVAEFEQEMNPGPAVAQIGAFAPKGEKQPTVAEFRKQIDQSFAIVAEFRKDLQSAIAAKDSGKIISLLRQRQAIDARRPWGADVLDSDASRALIALHDYRSLDEATILFGRGFRDGFATPAGVSYLMARINDDTVSPEKRIKYLDALPGPGATGLDGKPLPRPDHFLAGFAHSAIANAAHPLLSMAYLNEIEAWADSKPLLDAEASADLSDAIALLKALYDSTSDMTVKEQIEWTTWQASPAAYEKLGAPGGPIISIASTPAPGSYAKPKGRDFVASFSLWFCFNDALNHSVKTMPVLEGRDGVAHVASYEKQDPGDQDYDLSTFTMGGGSRSGFTNSIHPPASLPAGAYRLYLRFYENGKLLGRSHSVGVTLR